MSTVIVLGMHRSGTSMVAHILHELGVWMGERFREPDQHNPGGYWEDLDWRDLNKIIINDAGGTWWKPPRTGDVLRAAMHLHQDIADVVEARLDKPLWGFKDPRTMLTAIALNAFLPDPFYICVQRSQDAIVDSLIRRAWKRGYQESYQHWHDLVQIYNQRRNEFLTIARAPFYAVSYEGLLRDKKGVDGLASLLGVRNKDRIEAAKEIIRG